eukprot:scaffold1774_cov105-Skeletonema_menzelii.AAC.1
MEHNRAFLRKQWTTYYHAVIAREQKVREKEIQYHQTNKFRTLQERHLIQNSLKYLFCPLVSV